VGHCNRLSLSGKEHEEPPGVHPGQSQHSNGNRIKTTEGIEEPAVQAGFGKRLLKLGSIDHS
jgi:hypothetical protein